MEMMREANGFLAPASTQQTDVGTNAAPLCSAALPQAAGTSARDSEELLSGAVQQLCELRNDHVIMYSSLSQSSFNQSASRTCNLVIKILRMWAQMNFSQAVSSRLATGMRASIVHG